MGLHALGGFRASRTTKSNGFAVRVLVSSQFASKIYGNRLAFRSEARWDTDLSINQWVQFGSKMKRGRICNVEAEARKGG